MFDVKPISAESVPKAIERAERYRLLNEPVEAESICLDILEVDPGNQKVLVVLLLALTDQFDSHMNPAAISEATRVLGRLQDEYARAYFHGVICERRAKAHFNRGGMGDRFSAHEWFVRAMEHYETAEAIKPAGNDEAILRWNTCARILNRHRELEPPQRETAEQMLE
ncbi:MAG: hypothetical protein SGI88_00280 [Candidatus Hydrogenedentes bacterium]|nr:hypothetical protein [Candidatus Hydrogenedentota bacterium]